MQKTCAVWRTVALCFTIYCAKVTARSSGKPFNLTPPCGGDQLRSPVLEHVYAEGAGVMFIVDDAGNIKRIDRLTAVEKVLIY